MKNSFCVLPNNNKKKRNKKKKSQSMNCVTNKRKYPMGMVMYVQENRRKSIRLPKDSIVHRRNKKRWDVRFFVCVERNSTLLCVSPFLPVRMQK